MGRTRRQSPPSAAASTPDWSTVGGRLKWAREQAGFETAKEAADAIGIKYPTYAGHENANRGIGRVSARYAEFFGISLVWLVSNKGSPKGHPIDVRIKRLPADEQRQALEYLEFLENRKRR